VKKKLKYSPEMRSTLQMLNKQLDLALSELRALKSEIRLDLGSIKQDIDVIKLSRGIQEIKESQEVSSTFLQSQDSRKED
jgi:hypothetical protein